MLALEPGPFAPARALGFPWCGICGFDCQLGSIPFKANSFRACKFLSGGFCDCDLEKYIWHHLVGNESGSSFQVEKIPVLREAE